MGNKGFTLVELLATMALLAILMIMAVPNVIGVVQRNKNKTYVEDAKKLVSLAEYKVRSNSKYKPAPSTSWCFKLQQLGENNFDKAPNGGTYHSEYSYVRVRNTGAELNYYVQLVEQKGKDNYIGIIAANGLNSEKLYNDDSTKNVVSKNSINGDCDTPAPD